MVTFPVRLETDFPTSADLSDGPVLLTFTVTGDDTARYKPYSVYFQDGLYFTRDLDTDQYVKSRYLRLDYNRKADESTTTIKLAPFNRNGTIDAEFVYWTGDNEGDDVRREISLELTGATPDGSGPELEHLSITPNVRMIDGASVALDLLVSDDVSGVSQGYLTFNRALSVFDDARQEFISLSRIAFTADDLDDGAIRFEYLTSLHMSGFLSVSSVVLTDKAGNIRTLSASDLDAQDVARTVTFETIEGKYYAGTDGPDTLKGGKGPDTLDAGDGDDTLYGNKNADTLFGGRGDDVYIINSSYATVAERSDDGIDTVHAYVDMVRGSFFGVEKVIVEDPEGLSIGGSSGGDRIAGGDGRDVLTGYRGDDYLTGGAGRDFLTGGLGDDRLVGGSGRDMLLGGEDADTLLGREQSDVLMGGKGPDTFVFTELRDSNRRFTDKIAEAPNAVAFANPGKRRGDTIDVSGIDAKEGKRGNQSFTFDGTETERKKGHLWVKEMDGDTIVLANTDSDEAAEFKLIIEDGQGLRASDYSGHDFIL